MGPAGLGTGSRQTLAAERLDPDHRADHRAVDVEVADLGSSPNGFGGGADAAVNAQGQTVAGAHDPFDRVVEVVPCGYVQERAEGLAIQVFDPLQADDRGRDKPAACRLGRQGRAVGDMVAPASQVRVQFVPCGLIDHRSDIGAHVRGIADDQLGHRTLQHLERRIGDILVQEQEPQGGAALAGRQERRGDDVAHHLLGQGGRIHQHGVDAAGLGDQRHDRPGLVVEQGAGDGEGHTRHVRIGGQRLADLRTARNQVDHVGGRAGLKQQPHGGGGDQRRLRRGLGDHCIAGDQGGDNLAGEDR